MLLSLSLPLAAHPPRTQKCALRTGHSSARSTNLALASVSALLAQLRAPGATSRPVCPVCAARAARVLCLCRSVPMTSALRPGGLCAAAGPSPSPTLLLARLRASGANHKPSLAHMRCQSCPPSTGHTSASALSLPETRPTPLPPCPYPTPAPHPHDTPHI